MKGDICYMSQYFKIFNGVVDFFTYMQLQIFNSNLMSYKKSTRKRRSN